MQWSLNEDSDQQSCLCEYCQRLYPEEQYQGHWQSCFDRKNIMFKRRGRQQQSKMSTISTTTNTTTKKPQVTEEKQQEQKQSRKYEQKSSQNKPPQNQSSKLHTQIESKTLLKLSSKSSQQMVQENTELKKREYDYEKDVLCPKCYTQIEYQLFGAHKLTCQSQLECFDSSHLFPQNLIEQSPELGRKRTEASSLANQRAVIGGSSAGNHNRGTTRHLQTLMDAVSEMRENGQQDSALFQQLQSNAIIEFFTARDKGFTDEKTLCRILECMRYKKEVPQGEDCPICCELMEQQQTITILPCKHLHHEDCIKLWLKKETNCPICKGKVNFKEENEEKGQIFSMSELTQETDAFSQKTQETKDN